MKQRESVYNAVLAIMGPDHTVYVPNKDERSQIIAMVTESLVSGETDFSDAAKLKYDTDAKVKSYTAGLVSNWLRKDTNLNGGTKYVPKNPGSRTGMRDPQIKALRQLLKIETDTDKIEAITEQLNIRTAEVAAAKVKDVDIDITALPAHLVEELGLGE